MHCSDSSNAVLEKDFEVKYVNLNFEDEIKNLK